MRKNTLLLLTLACAISASAKVNIHETLNMELFHFWRGFASAKTVTFVNDLSFSDKNDHFFVGVWGAVSVTGNYREFDYYLAYNYKGLTVSLWDYFDFSPGAYDNPEAYKIFNYNCHTTAHALDFCIDYFFGDKVPLKLSWNTILWGGDRGLNKQGKEVQRYSTYVEASYKVFENDKFIVTPSIGAEFAFRPTLNDKGLYRATYYGNRAMINEIRLSVTYKLKICSYDLPITAICLWNPETNKGYFGASATLFSF
ncbi:MAG: hypothetical protein HUK14_11565 [Muribaculaceae bacterium]|nr:hypothetical protein [Muribaculaceae bacterium]